MSKVTSTVKPKIAYGALLGRVIDHHRAARKINQEAVAAALGITQSAYSKLEKGQSTISVVQLNTIAAQLNMPASTLIQDTERYAAHLRRQGVAITNEKQESSAAGLLIALGLLAALLAAAGS